MKKWNKNIIERESFAAKIIEKSSQPIDMIEKEISVLKSLRNVPQVVRLKEVFENETSVIMIQELIEEASDLHDYI